MEKRELPPSFSGAPGEEPHHYFKKLCKEFKKTVERAKSPDQLEMEMEKLLNASKDMHWAHGNPGIHKKEEGEKAMSKLWSEFSRYLNQLEIKPRAANPQDLLDALKEIELLLNEEKIT